MASEKKSTARKKPSPIEVGKHLKGIKFPVNKQDLIEHARQTEAPRELLSVLERIPDREFRNAADVTKGVGEVD
ncbi:MAG TPA: DUF2795 domain-containing protein [Haliangium sp.]|nr:DUF2795 domain-containing protein [Haliangium sp.]